MGIFEAMGRNETPDRPQSMLQGAAAGTVGAMAMTGIREFATAMGWVQLTPPEDIARNPARSLVARIPPQRREAAIELAHWAYGGMGGAAFGLLPRTLRRRLWVGPLYGLATWAFFQTVLAPALGLQHAEERPLSERAVLIADHLVYGLIVSEPLATVTG
jgi:uncharacterized membrane protein YagU involved in acid resistance